MTIAVFPKYQDIFPDREVPILSDVVAKCSSKTLLKAVSFLNAKVHLRPDDIDSQEQIFWRWIGVFSEDTQTAISSNYMTFKMSVLQDGHSVTLFSSNVLLQLIDCIIRNFNDLPEKPTQDIEDEMTLLEAWLVINADFDLEVAENVKAEEGNILGVMLINQAKQYEFSNPKDFFYQTLLAGAFFTFLSSDSTLSAYLQEFLSSKKVADYKEYLRHLIGVYTEAYKENSLGFRVPDDESSVIAFFDSLAYDLAEDPFVNVSAQSDPDFKLFRDRPLIKDGERGYYPVHHNFFIDKIYQGLLFDFYRNTSIKHRFRFDGFLQFLGHEFAESWLFHNYVKECFAPKKYLTAVEGNSYLDIEYSDYYVREGNTLYLFEFKNSMVNARIKHSKDFAEIKAEIVKKLVRNDRNKPKGVEQLLNVIHKVSAGGFIFDDFKAKGVGRLHIYPIIVYTDDFFSLDGIQSIVSKEFQQLLLSHPVKRHQVNDVTLLHLSDLINIEFSIQSRKTTFKAVVQEFLTKQKSIRHRKPRSPEEFLDKSVGRSFHSIMHDTVKPYANPELLMNRISAALGLEANS